MSTSPQPRSSAGPRCAREAPVSGPAVATKPFLAVLTGNPNCGKTTLFNALTGLRAKVGNYAGVTVERKEGRLRSAPSNLSVALLDLPGTYSLSPQSLDEQIARDVLFHRLPDVPRPGLVIVVVDASNLERNLYYATQVLELGYPTIVALNMVDVAAENGHDIDARALADALGIPVIPTVANSGEGIAALRQQVLVTAQSQQPPRPAAFPCPLPPALEREVSQLAASTALPQSCDVALLRAATLLALTDEKGLQQHPDLNSRELSDAVGAARTRLEQAGIEWRSAAIEARYACAGAVTSRVLTERLQEAETFSDRLDRVVTHRIWGTAMLVALMALMFQSIFIFAQWPMGALESGVHLIGRGVSHLLPTGDLKSLVVDGAIAGVGAVVVFLPQILLLFLFIGLLEDTGYMARAAFLMDRLMSKVGLHGKSFIPLLSSFACAIPGIMATRTIESPKDRLVTMLVAPLMTCSARLPVYALLIAACVPDRPVLGLLRLQGLTMLAMYLLGIVAALGMAWLLKKTLLRGEPPMLIMELPPYRRPVLRVVLCHMWERSKLFLQRAGTVILGASIVLWFLASYPRNPEVARQYDQLRAMVQHAAPRDPEANPSVQASLREQLQDLNRQEAGARLRDSFAGRLGRAVEPILAPLGFDWKIGIGIVASFAAREVFVSTMSTVYNVGAGESGDEDPAILADTLRVQRRPDGSLLYTGPLTLALMVFYVFALQCVSTVAVVRRETNSWKWPAFQWIYMGVLAWTAAFLTYHGARLLSG